MRLHRVLLILLTALSLPASAPADPLEVWTFPSAVTGLSIDNAQLLSSGQGSVYRGAQPLGHAKALVDFGVTEVLIFKNDLHGEVAEEIDELVTAGIPRRRIFSIPFRRTGVAVFEKACKDTVSALKLLLAAYLTDRRVIYFHDVTGGDQAGYLAGVFRLLTTEDSIEHVFHDELCANGYEAADPRKPRDIVSSMRRELTPTFLKMARLIRDGDLTLDHLELSVCDAEPKRIPAVDPDFTCKKKSARFRKVLK